MSEYEPWEVPGFFETKEHQEERLRNAVCCDVCGREMHMVVSYIPGIPDPQYDYYKCSHCDTFKRKEKKMNPKRKSTELEFWTFQREDGKYLKVNELHSWPSPSLDDLFTDDVMNAMRFISKDFTEQVKKSYSNDLVMRWPAEIAMSEALKVCKPVHVKMQIVYEVGEE